MKRLYQFFLHFPHKGQLIYALTVIVVIPLLLIINTLLALRSFSRDMNQIARDQATLALDIINTLQIQQDTTLDEVHTKYTALIKENKLIQSVTYLMLDPNKKGAFVPLFTTDEVVGNSDASFDLVKWAYADNQAYIALTRNPRTQKENWTVTAKSAPFAGRTEDTMVVVRVDVSMISAFLERTAQDSLLLLVAELVGVLLLLINHFKFFDYANLYTKLKEVDQMKDDFFSTASHELRTPLTAIKGYAQMAQRHADNPEKFKHDLEVISLSAARLGDLVEDMLDVSRIEQGRMKLELVKVNPAEVVQEVIEELTLQANDKGLQLFHDMPNSEMFIMADRNKLKQIMINLVGNGVKYTLKGEVRVFYEVGENQIKIVIKDTGLGMTAEQREKLFTKFYRIQTDETKSIQGTGLGLWITKQIIELMQGKIFVDSIKGTGSQFMVEFPRIQ